MPMLESVIYDDTTTGFLSGCPTSLQTQDSHLFIPSYSAYLSLVLDRCLPFLDHIFPV